MIQTILSILKETIKGFVVYPWLYLQLLGTNISGGGCMDALAVAFMIGGAILGLAAVGMGIAIAHVTGIPLALGVVCGWWFTSLGISLFNYNKAPAKKEE